jgi:putative spermidine/putrescine transport system substrate-binding protein
MFNAVGARESGLSNIVRRRVLLGGAAALAAPLILSRASRAAERSITVGIYTGPQGDYVRQNIIPPFEAKHKCKVYTTFGVTLEQIATLRATRNNPRYSVMFVDDIGVPLAKAEGLIEKLPQDRIPNMAKLLPRFLYYEGYGAAFAMSTAGMAYNSQTGKPLKSYNELWDERFPQRFLMVSPKSTQSLYLLIAAVTLETGKSYAEAQYLIEQAWPKMAALKPNVLSIYENQSTVMQVAQGEADIAGMFYSKSVYPYTAKGAPVDMCFPREGTFAGINCLTLVKNAPEPELGMAFIDWMLDPTVQQGLAEASLAAPTITGLEFKPDVAKYIAYPEAKMDEMGVFSPDWNFINPIRPKLLEKYNQVFGS